MKKQTRQIITILTLIFIIFSIFYLFNICNLKYTMHGIAINTVTNGNTTITTTTGKSLNLPDEFLEHKIALLEGDNIISIVVSQTNQENNSLNSTEAIITTQKSIEDIFNYYSSKFSNPITTKNDKTAIIIGGDAENLIKVTIENEKYKIYMEKR